MPKEIKTTIAVDGEAAFKRAINEANTSLRNMGTQLTLAQAQFKKDGDAMKLMETRSKTLKDEIDQQENIVKALGKAVEDSSKAYGENSDKTEKWQAELNRAKAKLVNLQNELTLNEQGLDRNGKAFDDSSQKAADYQATLQTIGKNVSFETVTSGIGKITGTVESAIKKVFSLGKTIKDTMVEAGNWADDIMTEATKSGMDVETYQRWKNAADFIDTPVETIIGARDKLGKAMKNGWKDGKIDMWEFLGINLKDENGNFRDQMDVMWEVGESLMNMTKIDGNDVRADAYAMQIFGKSWRDLMPLFTAGRDEWEKTVAEQRVVSEDHVKSLASMDDANQRLTNSWETLKYSFLAEIAPTVQSIVDAMADLLDEFNEWMDTDEGKQAMQDLSDAIKELFSGLKDVSFKDAVDTVKGAIEGIKNALIWLDEHKNDVVTALKIIAGGFAVLKVADIALNIGKIVTGFQTLSNLGAGSGGGATEAGTATTAAGGGLLSKVLGSAVLKAAAGIGTFVWAMSPDNPLFGKAGNSDLWDESGNPTDQAKELGITETFGDYQQKYEEQTPDERAIQSGLSRYGGGFELVRGIRERDRKRMEAAEAYWDELRKTGGVSFETSENLKAAYMRKDDRGNVYIDQDGYNAMIDRIYGLTEKDNWESIEDIPGLVELPQQVGDTMELLRTVIGSGLPSDGNANGWNGGMDADLTDAMAEMRMNTESTKASMEKIAGADIKKFNGLPAELRKATQDGTAQGISGIKIYLDGSAVGRLVAPYVSSAIANAIL